MSNSENSKPRATIVIEWENIQLAEESRCYTMLSILSKQIDELHDCSMKNGAPDTFDVLVLYDNEKCDGEAIRNSILPHFRMDRSYCKLRMHTAPGRTYYEQKNLGAREAASDIVVYVDSDVIPEEGWLAAILSPFADPNVKVCCGNSFLSASGPYSKAFAAFWFFPLKSNRVIFEQRRTFFANNVAFRRDVLLEYPFEAVSGTTRGSCIALGRRLRKAGIPIYHHSAAQVSHPAPFGWSHFITRALAQGRDHVVTRRALGKSFLATFPKACLLPFRAIWKIVLHRRALGLSLVELPAALAVGLTYNTLVLTGEIATRIAPGYMTKRWHI
jgi:hypothetical protein